MADGTTKAIEDIKPGEWVLADDPEDDEKPKAFQVKHAIKSITSRIIEIYIDDGDGIIDGKFKATGKHPFYTQNRGWQYAENLAVDDVLLGHK
ncbi:MAG: polymorphic toxin-type HINT domain-containing protein, partial [Alphaproteobacteria bacterium]